MPSFYTFAVIYCTKPRLQVVVRGKLKRNSKVVYCAFTAVVRALAVLLRLGIFFFYVHGLFSLLLRLCLRHLCELVRSVI